MGKAIRIFLFIWAHGRALLPTILLLVLHFVLDLSIWWAVLAFGLWIAGILLRRLVVRWARYGSRAETKKANKNPYSLGAGKSAVKTERRK